MTDNQGPKTGKGMPHRRDNIVGRSLRFNWLPVLLIILTARKLVVTYGPACNVHYDNAVAGLQRELSDRLWVDPEVCYDTAGNTERQTHRRWRDLVPDAVARMTNGPRES
jgi:hypothetical protein